MTSSKTAISSLLTSSLNTPFGVWRRAYRLSMIRTSSIVISSRTMFCVTPKETSKLLTLERLNFQTTKKCIEKHKSEPLTLSRPRLLKASFTPKRSTFGPLVASFTNLPQVNPLLKTFPKTNQSQMLSSIERSQTSRPKLKHSIS